eukprot:13409142-Alexandrium_andersonii.AAC.1
MHNPRNPWLGAHESSTETIRSGLVAGSGRLSGWSALGGEAPPRILKPWQVTEALVQQNCSA